MRNFTNSDLEALGRAAAIESIRSFLRATGEGHTHAPPRVRVPLGARTLVYTVGGSDAHDISGFRMYSIGDGAPPDGVPSQLVVAIRQSTGELLATGTGDDFGAWRTAALGAVAMTEATAHIDQPIGAAILGAGYQAFHHARTWAAARPIARFHVWARREEAAKTFAADLSRDTGIDAQAHADSDSAVRTAEAVLGVTRSEVPVIHADAVRPDAYIATVGPKFGGRNEMPAELYASAGAFLSDAPAQCANYESTLGPLPGGRTASEMLDLSLIVAGKQSLSTGGRRFFVSEGLAGSEVALLHALLSATP